MLESRNDKALYPLVAIASSILIFAGGLALAGFHGYYFLAAVLLILICFGMGNYVIKILPAAVILCGLYFLICFLISHSLLDSINGAVRIAGVCLAMVPGMSIPPVNLTRALNDLKFPRSFGLGILITLRFFPLLALEIRNIRDAMKTRGAGYSVTDLYRSTILPFCMRLVNISDLLALSVETRGFSAEGKYTVWEKVRPGARDWVYISLVIIMVAAAAVLLTRL